MKGDFQEDISKFIRRLKRDSEELEGDHYFERLMHGLSEGSIGFRWNLGGRLYPSKDEDKKPRFLFLRYLISAPIIYAMIVPIAIIDLSVSLYQATCFRLWKIPQVKRSKHILFDRQRLSYLNPLQKINCTYCAYANGVFAYARMIAGRTERYWCPVKHAEEVTMPHNFYLEFSDYGDREGWNAIHSGGVSNWTD